MDATGKKPDDTTPKTTSDPTSKKPDDQHQKPPTLEEEIRSFEKRAEAFLSNRGAQELVVESKELVTKTFATLQQKTQELEKEREDHGKKVQTQDEQIAVLQKEARESAEKEGIARKEVEALKKEIRELREKTVTDLERQLTEGKEKTENLEKQLADARAKIPKEPQQDSSGAVKAAGPAVVVLLVVAGIIALALFSKSGPQSIVSTGGSSATQQTHNGVIIPGMSNEKAVEVLLRDKYPQARVIDHEIKGNEHELLFCDEKGDAFEFMKARYQNGSFSERLIPRNQIFEDERLYQPPCYNSALKNRA